MPHLSGTTRGKEKLRVSKYNYLYLHTISIKLKLKKTQTATNIALVYTIMN